MSLAHEPQAQRVTFGAGSFGRLEALLQERQVRRLLLVTGQASYDESGARAGMERLVSSAVRVTRFCEFERNLRLDDVERGVELVRDCQPDLVVAIGGGSVLDCAKAIRVLACQSGTPRDYVLRNISPRAPGVPLVAVPTTAGSGSEATRFSTVYVDGRKHSLDHIWLRPEVALVDPALCDSMPPRLRAATGMDALSQAIESYWAAHATEASRVFAAEAIACLLPSLQGAVSTGSAEHRACMSRGAYLAGRAIDISRTTAAHAVSYPLTIHLGIPHGHAVALTLPWFMRALGEPLDDATVNDPRGVQALQDTLDELWRLLGVDTAAAAALLITQLMAATGLETSLSQFEFDEATRSLILREVNPERLRNHPVRLDSAAVEAVLCAAG